MHRVRPNASTIKRFNDNQTTTKHRNSAQREKLRNYTKQRVAQSEILKFEIKKSLL